MGRTDFVRGARAVAPTLTGIVPFGFVAGATAVDVGLSHLQTIVMSVAFFAGTAQLAALQLIGTHAPLVVVVLTALVINVRFTMYSASISPYFRRFGAPITWLGAYLISDQAYAVSIIEFRETNADEQRTKWFYFGAALTFWMAWQASVITGVFLGASVPNGLSLRFAVPLTFMALLFPSLEDRPVELAAVVGGGVSALAAPIPFDLGLVVAALVGITVGVTVDLRRGTFPTIGSTSAETFETSIGGEDA